MPDLSEVLGSMMISLVHARRMADEETAAVAEYYKDNPLLEGMSLPRVRVPELTIDLPVTIDDHADATRAQLDTPGNIHKALMQQLNSTLDDEDILSSTKTFQSQFNKDAKKAIERVYEQQKSTSGKITREAMVRAVDDALQSSLKKSSAGEEIAAVKKTALTEALRHRVSSVALKSPSIPASLKASALTSDVKEKSTPESSVRLSITLREEGLEWATSESGKGGKRSHLLPE
ncbi:MAG: amidase [Oceanospirillaceae bacterium]|mgnify:CR=1 FL=1|nr:amidase [Oceanospirillaceae bacterium]MBT13279.1 amidase [Oceanospirillaceae bacterium]